MGEDFLNRSSFGFCPNSGDFSVDSVHKRLFLTPVTGEIFERQKVPNLIWRSWSELVDSYSWVYNPPIKPNGTASLMLAQTLVYLTQVRWVASIYSQSTFNSTWYIWRHTYNAPWEKDRNSKAKKCVVSNYYVWNSSFGSWPLVRNRYINMISAKYAWNFYFLQTFYGSNLLFAFWRLVWHCIWIWAARRSCLRLADWNNCTKLS